MRRAGQGGKGRRAGADTSRVGLPVVIFNPGNPNGIKIKMNILLMLSWRGDMLSAWAAIYIHNGAAHHVC